MLLSGTANILVYLTASVLAAALIIVGVVIGRIRSHHRQILSACHNDLSGCRELAASLQQANTKLQTAVAALETRNQRIPQLEQEGIQWRERCDQLQEVLRRESAALARAVEIGGRAEQLERDKKGKEDQLAALEQTQARAAAEIAKLRVMLDEERKQGAEKLALLFQAREQLKTEFENLAQQIFEEKGRKFADQNRTAVDHLISPLRDQIGEFKKRVEDVYDKETRDRTALYVEINHLKELNRQISKEALNLTRALKGDSKTRGNWGEVVLERVLETSGLRKGCEYDIQVSLRDEGGTRFQPDVIVHLPEDKDVIIDAKVSLKDYEAYFSGEDPAQRAKALSGHIAAMRSHIRSLAAKGYESLNGVRSLDFTLMFVPIEAAFLAAVEKDRGLFSEAFEKNIIVVSPSTLLVTLRTIQNIWRHEYQNRNTLEIARKAGGLYDKFVGFVEALEEVGQNLDRARTSYRTAYDRLASGRGNLVRRSQELKALGVKVGKDLPRELLEKEGDET